MFERVSFSVLMFQTYDSSCDIFCMLEYSFSEPLPSTTYDSSCDIFCMLEYNFSEPLPSTTCSKVVVYSLILFVCFVTCVHSCVLCCVTNFLSTPKNDTQHNTLLLFTDLHFIFFLFFIFTQVSFCYVEKRKEFMTWTFFFRWLKYVRSKNTGMYPALFTSTSVNNCKT